MVGVVLMAAWVSNAAAATGLQWRWEDGEDRRFYARSQITMPQVLEVNAANNVDAQATTMQIELLLTCRSTGTTGKTAFSIRCDIDQVSLRATPWMSSRGRLALVLPEWERVLEDDAWIELEQSANGRIRNVDLEGTDKRIERLQAISENMRQLLIRALAPLDTMLPRKGDDHGAGAWTQTESLIYMLPSNVGTFGSPMIIHQVQRVDPGQVVWSFHGEGTIASGEQLGDNPMLTVAMPVDGSAVFDTVTGVMLECQFLADGRVTSSSVRGATGNAMYAQTSLIKLLRAGDTVPKLAPSEELPLP